MRYIRTTHIGNTPKGFSAEANRAWQLTNAGFVGHMLSPTEPSSVQDIHAEIVSYCQNDDDSTPLTEPEITEALEILIRYEMARRV